MVQSPPSSSTTINPSHLRQLQQQKQHHHQQQQTSWRRMLFWFSNNHNIPYGILISLLIMSMIIQCEYQTLSNNNRQLLLHVIINSSSASNISNRSSMTMSSYYDHVHVEKSNDYDNDDSADDDMMIPSECFHSEQEMKNLSSSHHHQSITWQGTKGINKMVGFGFGDNLLCHELLNNTSKSFSSTTSSATLQIEFNCHDAFKNVFGATGNQLLQFYGTRLAARAFGNVDMHVHCSDALQHTESLILPWITGYFPAVKNRLLPSKQQDISSISTASSFLSSSSSCTTDALSNTYFPNITQSCQAFSNIPLAYAIPDIRYDLRRMALSMIHAANGGSLLSSFTNDNSPIYQAAWKFQNKYLIESISKSNNNNSSSSSITPPPHHGSMDVPFVMPPPSPPLARSTHHHYPKRLQLDDVVIHFRCGDLMSLGHPNYSFIPFYSFTRHISPNVQSIGIVTQSFQKTTWSRAADIKTTGLQRCRIVIENYQLYLQEIFPNATVTIHNSPSESMTIAYTRMIFANQTFCMASTFPIFPALATFGHAYIHVPNYPNSPSQFLLKPQPSSLGKSNDNIHLLQNESFIMSNDLIRLWKRHGQDAVISWFRQTPPNNISSSTTSSRAMHIGNVRARVSV